MLQDFHDRGIYLTEDEYRAGLRTLFSEDYQEFSDEELEDIVYDKIWRMSPSEAEGFFSSIGNFFKNQVAPVALAALPAVTTIAGTVLGGPAGGAAGNALGSLASNAISGATRIRPNQLVSNIAGAASSIAGGNIQGAIPNLVNVSRDVGNAIRPGVGNRVANIASNVAQTATSLAQGNYQGAISGGINATRDIGNTIRPGAGNNIANVASGVAQLARGFIPGGRGNNANTTQNQTGAASQLLGFLQSTPFLQSMLSSIATGNMGTGLQIPAEDGSVTNTSYMEMLESLKYLTENAIIEVDNAGFSGSLPIESEADKDAYIGGLVESINTYQNSLLPDYDSISYN